MTERFEIDYEKLADTIYDIASRAWRQQTLLPMYADQLRAAIRRVEPEPERTAEAEYPRADKFVAAVDLTRTCPWLPSEELRAAMEAILSIDRAAVIEECIEAIDKLQGHTNYEERERAYANCVSVLKSLKGAK